MISVLVATLSFTVYGKGPHALFSSGLYGIMPPGMYSKLLKPLSNEYSLILSNGGAPVIKERVEEFCEDKSVNEFTYIAHSSFDHRILSLNECKNAVLIDPISLPTTSFENRVIRPTIPVQIIKCKYSYKQWNKRPFILPGFETHFYGDLINLKLLSSGHVDVLDDVWAEVGSKLGIDSLSKHEGDVLKIREEVRQTILDTIISYKI